MMVFIKGLLSWAFKIATSPALFCYYALVKVFASVLSIYPPPSVNSKKETTNFVKWYEKNHGKVHPIVFKGSFLMACRKAKEELKAVFVYLHSEEHPESELFCSETFRNPELVEILDSNFVTWVGLMTNAEGFKVADDLGVTGYPFIGVLAFVHSKRHILLKIDKSVSSQIAIEKVKAAGESAAANLLQFRREKEEREATQRLREEQDAAFAESLKRDQEKERKKQEVVDAKRKEQEEERIKLIEAEKKKRAKERQRAENSECVPDEPTKGSPDSCFLKIRLPTGQNLERNFNSSDKVLHLYYYVAGELAKCEESEFENFTITSNFPKKEYNDQSLTLSEAGIGKKALLMVIDDDN